eukprot:9184605-Pyramimonas_sp.AAC.1
MLPVPACWPSTCSYVDIAKYESAAYKNDLLQLKQSYEFDRDLLASLKLAITKKDQELSTRMCFLASR